MAPADNDTWKAMRAWRQAAQAFDQAAEMVARGAPISDPTVRRMVTWGYSLVARIGAD